MNKNFGIVFSHDYPQSDPFAHMGIKKDVYEELFRRLAEKGFNTYVLNKNNYLGNGVFSVAGKEIKFDIVYDRSGGISFPIKNDGLKVVDNYEFKKLAWNKWEAYKLFFKYMPKTYLANDYDKLKTPKIVVKPVNGLKGIDIFIGNKRDFDINKLNPKKTYIAQEFVDTSFGIEKIVNGNHDLRVVMINNKIIWSHVRTPATGSLKANVSSGGNLFEVDVKNLPDKVLEIAYEISKIIYVNFDNPLFSIDFGVDKTGSPFVFEINDQIGFPQINMQAKDLFLKELVENFLTKI